MSLQIKLLATLTGHNAAIYALTRFGDCYLTGGGEGFIAEWQPQKTRDARLVAQVPEAVFCLCFAENYLLAGTISGNLYVIDYAKKEILKNIVHHQKGIFSIFYIQKSNGNEVFKPELLTAGGDGRLTFWNTETWQPVETLRLAANALRCIAHQKSSNLIAVGDSQSNITIVDTFTKKILKTLKNAHKPSVFCVCFSPCGKFLFSGGRDAVLKIWRIDDDFCLEKSINAHNFSINDVQFSPNGALFATASRDKTIKIWNAETHELLKVLDLFRFGAHRNSVNRLAWQSDTELLSVSDDRTVCLWSYELLF